MKNVLTSTSTTNALSAAQGKVLNDKVVTKVEQKILVANGTNINTLTTPGLYYNPGDAGTATMTNTPSGNAFSLQVMEASGTIQIWRRYLGKGDCRTW